MQCSLEYPAYKPQFDKSITVGCSKYQSSSIIHQFMFSDVMFHLDYIQTFFLKHWHYYFNDLL